MHEHKTAYTGQFPQEKKKKKEIHTYIHTQIEPKNKTPKYTKMLTVVIPE